MRRDLPSGRPCLQSGFTLIEVLVVLVVFGFVALILNQGMRFGVAAWARQARTVADYSDLDGVDRALRGVIEQMVLGGLLDPTAKCVGTSRLVQFVSRLPDGAAGLPTRTADIAIGVDDQARLVMRVSPHYRAPQGPPRLPATSILADRVAGIELAYWRPAGRDGPAGWVGAWSGQGLPALVRLHVTFLDAARRRWPDIVTATLRAAA